MKHQPFENWILQDTNLNQEDHRELQSHLKQCSQCLALHQTMHQIAHLFNTAPAPEPRPDFSQRWLLRMERVEQRKNRLILAVTLGGISLATVALLVSVGFQLGTIAAGFPQMFLNVVTMIANWLVFFNQLGNILGPLFRVSIKYISPAWLLTIGLSISGITAVWIYALTRSRTLQKELQR